MMANSKMPDIVVGIDIGQTCSGVAFSIGPDWCEPKTIQRWPSRNGTERKEKVATRVGYMNNGLKSWGESCDWEEPGVEVYEQFKLTLDDRWEDDRGYTSSDANKWYGDYLTSLHAEIIKHFEEHIPGWQNFKIEYNFSTPTTWKRPAMIEGIRKTIKKSGFESRKLETVRMSLTEAEAAAVEATTQAYKEGDVFLICDAGGGTTDVNILKVQSRNRKIELAQLDHVEGVAIGSTLIDHLMAQHIMDRLKPIENELDGEIYITADQMLKGKFEIIKHSFPEPKVEYFSLEIRSLPGRQSFEEVGIYDSAMRIERATLRMIFDEQIQRIFRFIDGRLDHLQKHLPHESVDYIILSGGFGSSPYLLEQVRRRYELNYGFTSENTNNVHIVRLQEPQMAVTKGLVRERVQQLGTAIQPGEHAFQYRRCRNSYGVIVSVDYDEDIHRDLKFTTNPITGKKTVENLVDWFIKQGETVDVEKGVFRSYGADLTDEIRTDQRHVRIVMARDPKQTPPQFYDPSSCEQVVQVKYKLTDNDMRRPKNRFGRQKKYWKAEFQFVVKIGAADLQFEIRGQNGLISSRHDDLEVIFIDEPEPSNGTQQQSQHLNGNMSATQ